MFSCYFNPDYTWKSSWSLPYESICGRMEKLRVINSLQPTQFERVVKINNSNRRIIFSKELLIYRKGTVKIMRYNDSLFNVNSSLFDDFASFDGIFDDRLRYCPECMKRGYHSFMHQLVFLDHCFIHKNTVLKYRCDCFDTYILNRKNVNVKIFQCEYCGKKIDEVPPVTTGILNSWWSDEKAEFNRKRSRYTKIYIADFLYTCWKNDGRFRPHKKLSVTQKQVLYDIFINGVTKLKPRYAIRISDNNKKPHKIIMSELLNQYISDKYDKTTVLNHYGHIASRNCGYEVGNYDIKLLSIFFIIRELQNKRYIDQINYSYDIGVYGGLTRRYTSDEGFIIDFIEDTYYNMNMKVDKCQELYNMMLEEYTRIRYDHIYSCFKNNYPESYPNVSGKEISYKNWHYPVYLFVQTQGNEILVY